MGRSTRALLFPSCSAFGTRASIFLLLSRSGGAGPARPAADRQTADVLADGDGWTRCTAGHKHWGRFGAAGLLLVAPGPSVLLQHRASWSHHGDTWGVPGGARTSRESAVEAALREAAEETGLDAAGATVRAELLDDHGGWSYTTVLASTPVRLSVHALDRESTDVRWVELDGVERLPLHPGFAATWPALRAWIS